MSKLNKDAKHAIDQMIAAREYICGEFRGAGSGDSDVNAIWEGYLTLVHALYTPEENYSVIMTPDILKKPDGET